MTVKIEDHGRARRANVCWQEGHQFKSVSGRPGHYRCKCGATALATTERLILKRPNLILPPDHPAYKRWTNAEDR